MEHSFSNVLSRHRHWILFWPCSI